ncbi:MAG: helix-turn-helix domain-containing protein [Polyangiales bacterium]
MTRTPGTRRKVHVEPRSLPPERPGPEGGVRDATRKARTAALATAALRLFLDRGVEAVTIDEIASRAGLAKGTFYTYFRDKGDVVEALLAPVTATIRGAFDRCEATLRDAHDPAALMGAYQELAVALADALAEHQGVALLYLQESRMPAVGARAPVALFAREVRERAVVLTLAARAHGLLRALDARVTANAVVGAVETLVFLALSGEDLGAPEEASAALIELMLHGVASSL